MQYDPTEIEKHLKQLQEKIFSTSTSGKGGGSLFWRPSEEKKVMRILPRIDKPTPFFETWQHFKFAGKNLYCPQFSEGLDCSICNFVNELVMSKKPKDLKLADELKAKLAFHAMVTESGSMEPKFWTFYSMGLYRRFLDYLRDPDYAEFTNLDEKGWNFKIYYVEKPKTTQRMPNMFKYNLECNPFKQELLAKKKDEDKVLEKIEEMEEKFVKVIQRPQTPQEIKEIFDEWSASALINGHSDTEDDGAEKEKGISDSVKNLEAMLDTED